jgi:hypothetical protein
MFEQIDYVVQQGETESQQEDGTCGPLADIENQEEVKTQRHPSERAESESSLSSSSEEPIREEVPVEPARAAPVTPAPKEPTAAESAALKAELGRFLTFEAGVPAG